MNRDAIVAIASDRRVQLGAASVLSAALGAGASYYITKSKLRAHYEEVAQKEIEEAKSFYRRLNKVDEEGKTLTPADILARHEEAPKKTKVPATETKATDALRIYTGEVETPAETEQELLVEVEETVVEDDNGEKEIEVVERNVFIDRHYDGEDGDPSNGWDYETELARRSGDKPYVITHDEFYTNDRDYEQISLTYFEGDDVLTDDKDSPVPDPDATIGEGNLNRFGHGSDNPNIVYIQNDAIDCVFEILRSKGSYAAEVHGFIEHDYDDAKGVRKFRRYND